MSQSAPTDPRPRDDRTVVAIAWAVAAVAFALAAAFIAWLALGRDSGTDDGGAAAPAPTSSTAPSEPGTPQPDQQPTPDEGSGDASASDTDAGSAAPDPGATEQTPEPEVAELLLSLQRRDPADTMAVGEVDAPVVMIEYADYRCPYCARFHLEIRPELMPAVEDGTLRIEFRDLVIFEETSELAAVAGRAAAEQGHLEDFQAAVFALSTEGHGEFDAADLVDIAEEVGVPDVEQFEADLENEELIDAVRSDTAEGRQIGVSSTPTFLINTQVLQGAYPAERMLELIEQERLAVSEEQPSGR
ncbi:thioredoxin domain-containing protein [Ornithinimicrobium sp. LYQ92]|uniref:DsbA family protein n=1 Tax=Serinicoccus sp. LYQ92 TaxID=3378798 RepID=UPI003853DBDD